MSNFLTKDEAVARAYELASLLGPRWSVVTRQETIWFYGVELNDSVDEAKVQIIIGHVADKSEYTIYMQCGRFDIVETGTDPVKLLSDAKQEMTDRVIGSMNAFATLVKLGF
jgi:fructose-specific component phosphotransferase system IIB-like protein